MSLKIKINNIFLSIHVFWKAEDWNVSFIFLQLITNCNKSDLFVLLSKFSFFFFVYRYEISKSLKKISKLWFFANNHLDFLSQTNFISLHALKVVQNLFHLQRAYARSKQSEHFKMCAFSRSLHALQIIFRKFFVIIFRKHSRVFHENF